MVGQSGTERPEPVLVTMPPAAISSTVDGGDELRVAVEPDHACCGSVALPAGGALNVNVTSFASFSPSVTVCVCVPSFSCHASIV